MNEQERVSMLHYVDTLFEHERVEREATLDALIESNKSKANRGEFYISLLVSLLSVAIAIAAMVAK